MAASRALAASRLAGERFHRFITEFELVQAPDEGGSFTEDRLRRDLLGVQTLLFVGRGQA
jgi:hypothetical protein